MQEGHPAALGSQEAGRSGRNGSYSVGHANTSTLQQQQQHIGRADTGSSESSTASDVVRYPNPFVGLDPGLLGLKDAEASRALSETIETTAFDPFASWDMTDGGRSAAAEDAASPFGAGVAGLSHSQLGEKLQGVYQEACRSSHGQCCQGCGAPNIQTLLAGVQQLLEQQQHEHQRQLQQQRLMHQQEVEQIKSTAIKRIKEVMQNSKQ